VDKEPRSACKDNNCPELSESSDCVEKNCTAKDTGEEKGDSEEESGK